MSRNARPARAFAALRSFARSPRALESLERRLLFAARIVGDATAYATIQAAVNAASAGATIEVDAGVYSELVTVTKRLTIRGPRAGVDGRSNLRNDRAAEAVVNGHLGAVSGLRSSAFYLNADGIVLDGFTVEGQNATNSYNAGIHMAPGRSGIQILNNVVQNNATGINVSNDSAQAPAVIRGNLFRDNNQPGPHTGRAVYSDGTMSGGTLVNVVIDNNVFFKNYGYDPNYAVQPAIGFEAQSSSSVQKNIRITNNVFDYNGKGILAYNASGVTIANNVFTHNRDTTSGNLRFEGGMSNVAVRDNLFYANGARAIRIDQKVHKGANQNIAITNNNFFANGRDSGGQRTAIMVGSGTYTGTLDATGNYYGAKTGPSINVVGASGTGDTIWTGGNSIDYSGWKSAAIATGSTLQLPYFARPLDAVGAPIMFADYDHGGPGVAYYDTTGSNQGNVLHRYQGVDLQATKDPGFGISAGHQVAWVKSGEWIEYTLDVAAAGTYDLHVRLSNGNSAASPGRYHVEVDGANVTGSVAALTTGGTSTHATQVIPNVALPAGTRVVRFVFETSGSAGYVANFTWFKFAAPAAPPTIPAAPTGLAASAASASKITLTWTDASANESNFLIERSLTGTGNWTEVGTTPASTQSYSDTTVNPSTQYFYRVRAVNAAGPSDYSNTASATTPAQSTTQTLIAAHAIWKYLDDGSNQGTAWRALGFNDAAWKSGAGQLGYGDGDEATVVSYGSNSSAKLITTYFRKTFNVDDAARVTALALRLLRDDGAVVYLNGTEVFRTNMPTGTIGYTTRASTFIGGADENAWLTASIDPALLVSGANVLAVEIHQDGPTSSDISFDAELTATLTGTAPTPTAPSAPTGLAASAASSSQIALTWSDTSANESNFVIERSPNGTDNWLVIATTPANTQSYTDATAKAATQYFYRVRATNAAGPSDYSNTASATTPAGPSTVTLIPAGSTWKYLDNGSNQGTAWRASSFNDATWKSGAAELGYGDGDEETVVSYGPSRTSKYITTYFRKTFEVADPAAVGQLTMRLVRDDGVVVYINGVEVYRDNMPSGTIGYTTRATTFIGGDDEAAWLTAVLSGPLVSGTNTIAVEIHQDSSSSSDVSFNLELTATVEQGGAAPTARVAQSPTTTDTTTNALQFSTRLITTIDELSEKEDELLV